MIVIKSGLPWCKCIILSSVIVGVVVRVIVRADARDMDKIKPMPTKTFPLTALVQKPTAETAICELG